MPAENLQLNLQQLSKIMKSLIPLLLSIGLLTAQSINPAAEEKTDQKKPQFVIDIENLPEAKQRKYFEHSNRAKALFGQERVFDTLEELHSASKIYDKNPDLLNLQGACYVKFRNFPKAKAAFKKALKETPTNISIRFNIAEVDFVSDNFLEARKQLEELVSEAGDAPAMTTMLELIRFKLLLCQLKTDQVAKAQASTDASSFLDDSPFHYYSNAAIAYHNNENATAQRWLRRAARVFPATSLAPWQDNLIEIGFVKSIYGEEGD